MQDDTNKEISKPIKNTIETQKKKKCPYSQQIHIIVNQNIPLVKCHDRFHGLNGYSM